jgi:hypothetical protein
MPIDRGIWISSIVGMFRSKGGEGPCGSGQGSADFGALGPVNLLGPSGGRAAIVYTHGLNRGSTVSRLGYAAQMSLCSLVNMWLSDP